MNLQMGPTRRPTRAVRISSLIRLQLREKLNWPHLWFNILVEPILYLVLFGVGMAAFMGTTTFCDMELSYLRFFLPGLLAIQGFRSFSGGVFASSNDVKWGMYRLAILAGSSALDYVISRTASQGLIVATQGTILLAVGALLLKDAALIASLPTILTLMLLGMVFWLCLGMMVGVRIGNYAKRDLLASVLMFPVIFASSAFFGVEQAPIFLRILARLNPLTYCVDALRIASVGEAVWKVPETFVVLALAFFAFSLSAVLLHGAALATSEKWL